MLNKCTLNPVNRNYLGFIIMILCLIECVRVRVAGVGEVGVGEVVHTNSMGAACYVCYT